MSKSMSVFLDESYGVSRILTLSRVMLDA
jgi:hypothetical protein